MFQIHTKTEARKQFAKLTTNFPTLLDFDAYLDVPHSQMGKMLEEFGQGGIKPYDVGMLRAIHTKYASPSFDDTPLAWFKRSLAAGRIDNVNANTMRKIVLNFSARMEMVCRDVDASADLYEMVAALPSAITVGVIEAQCNIQVDGQFTENSLLLSASGDEGEQLALKLLKEAPLTIARSAQSEALAREKNIAELIDEASARYSFCKMAVVSVDIKNTPEAYQERHQGESSLTCLLMPRYVTTLARCAKLRPGVLVRRGREIAQALEYLHKYLHIVHMDVKADNVFITQPGTWHLGDFGSHRAIGEPVYTCTSMFLGRVLDTKGPARPKYDHYMCAVMLFLVSRPADEPLDTWYDNVHHHILDRLLREEVQTMQNVPGDLGELGLLIQSLLDKFDADLSYDDDVSTAEGRAMHAALQPVSGEKAVPPTSEAGKMSESLGPEFSEPASAQVGVQIKKSKGTVQSITHGLSRIFKKG